MIYQRFQETVARWASRTALVEGARRYSYSDLDEHVLRVLDRLSSLGWPAEAPIAAMLPNGVDYIAVFLAAAALGVRFVPINPALAPEEIRRTLSLSGAGLLVTAPTEAQAIADRGKLSPPVLAIDPTLFRRAHRADSVERTRTAQAGPFVVLQSSGSTGMPKLLARSQQNYLFEMDAFLQLTSLTEQDRILCAVPLYHSHGISSCMLPALFSGACLVLLEQETLARTAEDLFAHKTEALFGLLDREQISIFPSIPYVFGLLANSDSPAARLPESLRLCFSSGNFLAPEIFERFRDRYGMPIRQIYGCSEAGAIAMEMRPAAEVTHDSVGNLLPGIALRVVEDGRDVPPGSVGELWIASPAMTSGYEASADASAFRDGYFATGDLGRLAEDGRLFVTGRRKLLIDTGGNKVDPIEVESVLRSHPAVVDAVVVGVRGTLGNEIVKAAIELRQECTAQELIGYCRERLAVHKVPKLIEFRNRIPRSPTGKILRKYLVDDVEFGDRVRALVRSALGQGHGAESSAALANDASFSEMAIDSATILEVTAVLEREFGELPKTLLFEFNTINALVRHLVELHRDKDSLREAQSAAAPERAEAGPERSMAGPSPLTASDYRSEDIAIIGVHGRYPQAETLDELWQILSKGRDCVTEVPASRWDAERYYSPNKQARGASYARWGGFIDGVDAFDPLLFRISPREAELMDPQERLFLEQAWACFEDAGYCRTRLSGEVAGEVGVFVGVMWGDYRLLGVPGALQQEPRALPKSHFWSIANRVSYTFDLNGPSLAVDTACSSSLTALHLACHSLARGECRMALVGGVNLSLHVSKYLTTADGQFASTDGKCRSFGEGGDGYVPGEGVCALLLKPVRDAERDGDPIYAVIRGTALNHGGRANGYTVPNPNAQSRAIAQALERAQVDPASITYIEAHGAGTSLGDPVEVAGLASAFAAHRRPAKSCAIGSVKSNIGHLEAAAGVAGLTKVLLQLRHGKLAPSLHAEPQNPLLRIEETPFYVQTTLAEWPRLASADQSASLPRRAGVSSFGAGGTNVHVIVEEYPERPRADLREEDESGPLCFTLSAASAEQLTVYAQRLLRFLNGWQLEPHRARLGDLAYTLQIGREALEERLAIVCRTGAELAAALRSFLAGETEGTSFVRGHERQAGAVVAVLGEDELGQAALAEVTERWHDAGQLRKIANLWVLGVRIDWQRLAKRRWHVVSAPTYAFARDRYWFEPATMTPAASVAVVPREVAAALPVAATAAKPANGNGNGAREGDAVLSVVLEQLASALRLPKEQADPDRPVADLGVDSLIAVELIANINRELESDLPITAFFEHPTPRDLSRALSARGARRTVAPPASKPESDAPLGLAAHVQRLAAQVLRVSEDQIVPDRALSDYGLDSILAVEFARRLALELDVDLPTTTLFEHPTLSRLSIHLAKLREGRSGSLAPSASRSAQVTLGDLAARLERGAISIGEAFQRLGVS